MWNLYRSGRETGNQFIIRVNIKNLAESMRIIKFQMAITNYNKLCQRFVSLYVHTYIGVVRAQGYYVIAKP